MTYSIVARDERAGELGIAVQSRFFAAGRRVPWAEAGVGVIASQASTNPAYGREGLALLREGQAPAEALARLVSADPGAAHRQVAILDVRGRVAVHTSARCVAAAGHAVGTDCAAQANMVVRDTTSRAMVAAFEATPGALAERLVAALEAAQRDGGDIRGVQAAGILVVSTEPSPERIIDLRVDDHRDPIGEIKRLLGYARAHTRAGLALDKALAGRIDEALADLAACTAAFPDEPEFLARHGFVLLMAGELAAARDMFGRANAIQPTWGEYVLRLADAGIIPVRRDALAPVVSAQRP